MMSSAGELFDDLAAASAPVVRDVEATVLGPARVVRLDRNQIELRPVGLEAVLAPGHRARLVVACAVPACAMPYTRRSRSPPSR